jgi:hypothetical protein
MPASSAIVDDAQDDASPEAPIKMKTAVVFDLSRCFDVVFETRGMSFEYKATVQRIFLGIVACESDGHKEDGESPFWYCRPGLRPS